jgi:regulator of cell morphogenesis and NO signaling
VQELRVPLRTVQNLISEHKEARKILAELGALLGTQSDTLEREEAMPITADKTVRELAVEVPNATRLFEKLGIDYCCGGHKSLQDACATAKASIHDVVRALEQGTAPSPLSGSRDWNSARLPELVDHIVNKHHAYVKSEIPRLQALIAKVVGVHGHNHPELRQVQVSFADLSNELAAHMMKEERILFPFIAHMSEGNDCGPSCFGTVQNPIRMMMMEHDGAGEKLREMRQATANYALPQDACFTYRTLFNALLEFEADLHQHIHLENNILFPRALELERQ